MSKKGIKAFDRPTAETAPKESIERFVVGLD